MGKTFVVFCTILLLLSGLSAVSAERFQLDYSVDIVGFTLLPNDQMMLGMNVTGYFQSEVEFINGTQIIGLINSSSMTFPVGLEVNRTSIPLIYSGYTFFLNEKTFVPVRVIFHFAWKVNGTVTRYPGFNFTLPSDFLDEEGQCLGNVTSLACEREFSFQYWNVTADFSHNFWDVPEDSPGSVFPLLLILGIPVLLIFLVYKYLDR